MVALKVFRLIWLGGLVNTGSCWVRVGVICSRVIFCPTVTVQVALLLLNKGHLCSEDCIASFSLFEISKHMHMRI